MNNQRLSMRYLDRKVLIDFLNIKFGSDYVVEVRLSCTPYCLPTKTETGEERGLCSDSAYSLDQSEALRPTQYGVILISSSPKLNLYKMPRGQDTITIDFVQS